MYEEGLPNIWGNAQIFSHIWGGRLLYMTLQLVPSEFPYIWEKFYFLFYQFEENLRGQGKLAPLSHIQNPFHPQDLPLADTHTAGPGDGTLGLFLWHIGFALVSKSLKRCILFALLNSPNPSPQRGLNSKSAHAPSIPFSLRLQEIHYCKMGKLCFWKLRM